MVPKLALNMRFPSVSKNKASAGGVYCAPGTFSLNAHSASAGWVVSVLIFYEETEAGNIDQLVQSHTSKETPRQFA